MSNVFKEVNEDFFKSFPKEHGLVWYDKVGIMNLTDNRFIQFILDDVGTHDNFNGYWVEVYNKTSGLIYKKFFSFKIHFGEVKNPQQGVGTKYYHLWYNDSKLNWYIYQPTERMKKNMVSVMLNFINQITN